MNERTGGNRRLASLSSSIFCTSSSTFILFAVHGMNTCHAVHRTTATPAASFCAPSLYIFRGRRRRRMVLMLLRALPRPRGKRLNSQMYIVENFLTSSLYMPGISITTWAERRLENMNRWKDISSACPWLWRRRHPVHPRGDIYRMIIFLCAPFSVKLAAFVFLQAHLASSFCCFVTA